MTETSIENVPNPVDDFDARVSQFVEVVRGAAPDAVLAWTTDHAEVAPGRYHASWIDVFVPAVCGPLHLSWAWTLESPEESAEEAAAASLNPDDVGVTGPRWTLGSTVRSFTLVWPADSAVEVDGEFVTTWSTGAMEAAMNAWCAAIAGRPDVTFRFMADLKTPTEMWFEEDVATGAISVVPAV